VKKKEKLRIICPNGHLGFACTKEESFHIGAQTNPDYYCCDSGSDDIGPVPLGNDSCVSPRKWQVHDLELMLLAARKQNVPMIIGSAGDTGTNSKVDSYVDIIKELAIKHQLKSFKLAYFYSEVDKEFLAGQMNSGVLIEGLDGRDNLTRDELDATNRIVAVAGVHPFIKALENGADVIIGGRSSDAAVFAAPALYHGFSEDLAYYLGKVLECASFCAEPYGAKESVIGTITDQDVKITAMHPDQYCTIASVAGHAMYERSNPYYEMFAGGTLDMSNCKYEQVDKKTTRITGPEFIPINGKVKVKLEGAAFVGERYVGIAGVRDPYTIKNIDKVVDWATSQAEQDLGGEDYKLHFHIYGKNGVMGELEPIKEIKSHELGIVVEAMAKTKELAKEAATIGTRQIFYARLPEVKGTAGTAAFLFDEVLPASPAYRWTLNHTIEVNDAMDLFDLKEIIIGE
jgi:hypothetical protein